MTTSTFFKVLISSTLILFLSSASCGNAGKVEFIHCSNIARGWAALSQYPELELQYGVKVVCSEDNPFGEAEAVSWWFGGPGNMGKIEVIDTYLGAGLTHELNHFQLYETTGDPCENHSKECGWDWNELEIKLDEVKAEFPEGPR